MFKTLKIAFLALALGLAATPALADACSDAQHGRREKDDGIEQVAKGADSFIFTTDPEEHQKAACKNARAFLQLSKDGYRYHLEVDRACGRRIRWKTCDTECARRQIAIDEKKVAYECDPARIPEAIEKAKREKEEAERKWKAEQAADNAKMDRELKKVEACMNLTSFQKKSSSEAEWSGWVKTCNEAKDEMSRTFCVNAWLGLEKDGVSTSGMTCRPTKKERADAKESERQAEEQRNSPEGKRSAACGSLGYGGSTPQTTPELVQLCNQAEPELCGWTRHLVEDVQKKANPGLTCAKVEK